MAKTAPVKKKGRSKHSRAAKRASSPSIDTDKSLNNVKPHPESSSFRPSVLSVHQGAGVSKKSKNGRKSVLSSKAKRRLEKGLDRAEAVMDKKEKRIEKSRVRSKAAQERSKTWDDLNRKMLAKKAREEALAIEKENWVDEEDEEDSMLQDAVVDGVRDLEVHDAPPLRDAMLPIGGENHENDDEIL